MSSIFSLKQKTILNCVWSVCLRTTRFFFFPKVIGITLHPHSLTCHSVLHHIIEAASQKSDQLVYVLNIYYKICYKNTLFSFYPTWMLSRIFHQHLTDTNTYFNFYETTKPLSTWHFPFSLAPKSQSPTGLF